MQGQPVNFGPFSYEAESAHAALLSLNPDATLSHLIETCGAHQRQSPPRPARTRAAVAAAATVAILAVTPALTADQALECVPPPAATDFMQIHMDNQKIGSPGPPVLDAADRRLARR